MSMISVIIPTITGREDWLEWCTTWYRQRSPAGTEIIVVKDQPSCGHAWVVGAEKASGDYLHFTADDLEPQEDWWAEAIGMLDSGRIPAATVLNREGELSICDSPLGDLGLYPNVLVPLLSRELLDQDEWLLPIHYGSDDWVSYVAATRKMHVIRCGSYRLKHHVANHGRNYLRRHADVLTLITKMELRGYLPPVYERLELNLRTSKTGLDSVRINELDAIVRHQLRKQRIGLSP